MFQKIKFGVLWIVLVLMAAGCANSPEEEYQPSPFPLKELTPYVAAAATETPEIVEEAEPTPLPSPTPTPRIHVVEAGEDLGGISYLYKVSLQSLLELNPDVEPRALSVGTQLIIPPSSEEPTEEALLPAPTGVSLGVVKCKGAGEYGMWCFVDATSGDQSVENVTAILRVKLENEEEVRSELATSPMDRLSANSTLPLMAHFSFPVAGAFQASAELSTALPVIDEGDRYLDIRVRDVEVTVSPDGLYADVKGVLVNRDEKNAGSLRVVLIARDEKGEVVGVRIWESQTGLENGERIEFQERVYRVGGRIEEVSVLAEAKP